MVHMYDRMCVVMATYTYHFVLHENTVNTSDYKGLVYSCEQIPKVDTFLNTSKTAHLHNVQYMCVQSLRERRS